MLAVVRHVGASTARRQVASACVHALKACSSTSSFAVSSSCLQQAPAADGTGLTRPFSTRSVSSSSAESSGSNAHKIVPVVVKKKKKKNSKKKKKTATEVVKSEQPPKQVKVLEEELMLRRAASGAPIKTESVVTPTESPAQQVEQEQRRASATSTTPTSSPTAASKRSQRSIRAEELLLERAAAEKVASTNPPPIQKEKPASQPTQKLQQVKAPSAPQQQQQQAIITTQQQQQPTVQQEQQQQQAKRHSTRAEELLLERAAAGAANPTSNDSTKQEAPVPQTAQQTKQQQQQKVKQQQQQQKQQQQNASRAESAIPPLSLSPNQNNAATVAEKIVTTLQEIKSLQNTLPNSRQVARLVNLLQQHSFHEGFALFDLYRNYGNPYLDENFLIPGVRACCDAREPKRALQVVQDMLQQGRKVDKGTLRALIKACEETNAAEEVIEVWKIMEKEKFLVTSHDLQNFLNICHRAGYIDGALQVLKQLRLVKEIPINTYMHWMTQATRWWRADAFFDLLMEMRLSGVEPEIPSLTSLESGRTDLALTVMEGVRAVGLDPCFAMASVCSSIEAVVYNKKQPVITQKVISNTMNQFEGRKPLELTWDTQPIPQVLETQAAGLILRQESFRRLNKRQVDRVESMLQLLPIDANITLNLKNQLLRQSLIVNTTRIENSKDGICQEYMNGAPLIKLSEKYGYPPVALFRKILRARGMTQRQIKEAIQSPGSKLNSRDQQELRKAMWYDSTHRSDVYLSREYNPKSLEKALEHFFRSKGLRIKTEADLVVEQKESHGRVVLTPDILLLDPLVINGVPIRWIDAKNFYGSHIVAKRNVTQQLMAYFNEWGPGAVIFGMGYSDMLAFPGAICLDTSALPSTTYEKAKMRVKSFFYSSIDFLRFKKQLPSQLTKEYWTVEEREPRAKKVS